MLPLENEKMRTVEDPVESLKAYTVNLSNRFHFKLEFVSLKFFNPKTVLHASPFPEVIPLNNFTVSKLRYP